MNILQKFSQEITGGRIFASILYSNLLSRTVKNLSFYSLLANKSAII
jgi:hypothetical protein